MKSHMFRIAMVGAAGLLLSVAPGCGGPSPASPGDVSDARQALDRALAAWREGKSADSLKNDQPPLEASDHQWSNGLRLVKYEVQNDRSPASTGSSFRVTLWLKDSRSKQTKVVTQYDVTTDPLRVVRVGF